MALGSKLSNNNHSHCISVTFLTLNYSLTCIWTLSPKEGVGLHMYMYMYMYIQGGPNVEVILW